MSETQTATRQIARAAGLVMVAFVLSSLTGLIRQILVAQAFGTQSDLDAFNASNRVAETLFNLVAGGALASAFIPTFTGLLTKGEREEAWKLASALGNLIFIILILLSILAAFLAPQIVRYAIAPGFAANPSLEALTIELMRLMLISSVIFGLSGLVMGILNSHQVFFIPAIAPSMYQIGMIFGVLALTPRLGIFGLAWGVIIGASLHLGLQLPLLLRLNGKYFPIIGLSLPSVHEVLRLMAPRLLGVAVVQLNFWINTRLATQFAEGSVTGVVFGFTLMLMPQAAIAQSIAIAAMPTFSAQVALGKLNEMRSALASSLRGALILSIPASLGLIILRKPLISMLYQRGEFTANSTELVAWALLWYSAGLLWHALVEILSRAFYSLHDTKTPVMIGIGAMSFNIVLSYIFSAWFRRIGWMPHGGLALANTVATSLEAIVLIIVMRKRLDGLNGYWVLKGTLRSFAVSLLMGMALYIWVQVTGNRPAWFVAVGGVGIGCLVFIASSLMIGIHEIRSGAKLVIRRIMPSG